jgi:tetratricopeptide (TPR) repeat protein
MRALLILAAALLLSSPAQARDDKEATASCAANAARLAAPLARPRAPAYIFFWEMFLRPYDRPFPFDGAYVTKVVGEHCADKDLRYGAWSFMRHVLSAAGEADDALAVAEDRARVEPSDAALRDLITARLRKGDETGALAAARREGRMTGSDDEVLDRAYADVLGEAQLDDDSHAALALARTAERRWRTRVDTKPEIDTILSLISVTNTVGSIEEHIGDSRAAADAYGRAAALLRPLRSHPRDRYEEVSLETVMMKILVSRIRTLAALGERDAAIAEAREAVALVDGEIYAKPGSGLEGQIATGRWTSDPTSQPVADAFGQIGAALMKVDAPREAIVFLDVVARTDAANAKARGKRSDGAAQIPLAAARRGSGDLDGALATINEGLTLIAAIEVDGGYRPMLSTQALLERGEILAAQGKTTEACADFRQGRATYTQPSGLPLLDQALATLDARLASDACAARP